MKTYSISLLSGVIAVLLLIAFFNWRVNPFDVFSTPDIEGFNLYKAEAERRGRLSKIYQLNRIKPDFIILGSSRALRIPADYSGYEGMTGFNMALASGSSYELLRVFQHAHAVKPLKRVVMGLDESLSNKVQQNFKEERLAVNADGTENEGRWLTEWRDAFTSLLSFDALRASMGTVRKQPDESLDEYMLAMKKHRINNAGGHRQMFRRMESTFMAGYNGAAMDCGSLSLPDIDHDRLATSSFRKMLQTAYRDNIEFYIFFSPVHARLLEAQCLTGKWPDIENTMRAVVQLVEDVAEQYGRSPFPVWDFAGYNSITTEPVPPAGDKTTIMQWYWEGSHYSEATAKQMLNRIFAGEPVPGDFGVRIDTKNIEQELAKRHLRREEYLRTHADDIQEVRTLLSQQQSKNN